MDFAAFKGWVRQFLQTEPHPTQLTIEETDGTPSVKNVRTLKVTNGLLTDNGNHSVSLAIPPAGSIAYTPAVLNDWDSDADPGEVDDALDQLAERVDDIEGDYATGAEFDDHSARHENGGADEISVAGLSGELADAQTAKAHNVFSAIHGDTTGAANPVDGDIIIGNVTPKWSKLAISIPGGAGLLNVLGVVTGELRASWKALFDATHPEAIGAATEGTATTAAHRDHVHAADAANVTYTPAVATDWDGDADPGNLDDAVDQLAERTDDLEAAPPAHVHDASVVTYTPSVATDWDADADPGDVDNALDQLAERVDDVEGAAGHNAVTLAADADAIMHLAGQEIGLHTELHNTFFAGPTTGLPADPAFRQIEAADVGTGAPDGTKFLRDDMSWQVPAGGGSMATDPIWAAAGDLAVATGNDAAGVLTKGTDGKVLTMVAGAVAWAAAGGGSGIALWDADADTGIQVEEAADEDKIRFDTAGVERAVWDSTGFDIETHMAVGGAGTPSTAKILAVQEVLTSTGTKSGVFVDVGYAGTHGSDSLYGLNVTSRYQGTSPGSSAATYGLLFNVSYESAQTISNAVGVQGYLNSTAAGSGTWTAAAGFYVSGAYDGSKPATAYGLRIGSGTGPAGVVTFYGVRVEDSAATNPYLLDVGPTTRYFRVIGGAAPAANQTNVYINEGGTLRQVQWKAGDGLVAGDKVLVLV